MPKNIVLLCDGTANQFGVSNTNVVRVVQTLVRDDQEQFVYYDPGVGTLPGPGLVTRTGKFLSKVIDLAFATGLDRNVEEAYISLMNNWEPDDKVYLFGFSRGSYTARVLAALLYHVGLLPRGSENLIPYALRLLRIARRDNRNLGDQFRETFARPTGRADRRFGVHFIGLVVPPEKALHVVGRRAGQLTQQRHRAVHLVHLVDAHAPELDRLHCSLPPAVLAGPQPFGR